jgi:CubicO group peptidase (beta-lactamase class C family)
MLNATKDPDSSRNASLTAKFRPRMGGFERRVVSACAAFAGFSVLAVGLTGCGGSGSTAAAPPPQQTLGGLVDPLASSAMKQQGIPGMTVSLAKNGTMLYAQAYGDSDIATGATSQTSTIFEIGSITKQFTAALIMKLQEQGALHVDDSIQTYLPEYKFPAAITLRTLMNHTSGLANYTTFTQYPNWGLNGVSEQTILTTVSQTSTTGPRICPPFFAVSTEGFTKCPPNFGL